MTADLWEAVEQAGGKDIAAIADGYTKQAGRPAGHRLGQLRRRQDRPLAQRKASSAATSEPK